MSDSVLTGAPDNHPNVLDRQWGKSDFPEKVAYYRLYEKKRRKELGIGEDRFEDEPFF